MDPMPLANCVPLFLFHPSNRWPFRLEGCVQLCPAGGLTEARPVGFWDSCGVLAPSRGSGTVENPENLADVLHVCKNETVFIH
jgi:hypothetical protein